MELGLTCVSIIAIGILIGLVFTYFTVIVVDHRDFNNGICPKCGKHMVFEGKMPDHTYYYRCKDWHYISVITSRYLHWRYGRKLEKACGDKKGE